MSTDFGPMSPAIWLQLARPYMLLRMNKTMLLVPLILGCASSLPGQAVESKAQIMARCNRYLQIPLPAEATAPTVPDKFPSCHSLWLYYGFAGEKQNYDDARRCAWQERATFIKQGNTQAGEGPGDDGLETLANIYANGLGAQRNIPLATRFACESAELETQTLMHIEQLEDLAAKPAPAGRKGYFNMCDGEPSTQELNICAEWSQPIQDEQREQDMWKLSSSWPAPQKQALAALVKADENYANAHGDGEINLAGTLREILSINANEGLRDNFLAALRTFEQGNLPKKSPSELAQADANLNRIYRKAIVDAETRKSEGGAVQPERIRESERAWLKYRDMWIAFAALRYPAVSKETWITLLTNDRIEVLNDTSCKIGIDSPYCARRDDEQSIRPLP